MLLSEHLKYVMIILRSLYWHKTYWMQAPLYPLTCATWTPLQHSLHCCQPCSPFCSLTIIYSDMHLAISRANVLICFASLVQICLLHCDWLYNVLYVVCVLVMALNGSNQLASPTKPQDHSSPYGDPAYKKLSRINGDINKMNKDEMKEKLASLHLDTRYCTVLLFWS